MPYDEPSVDDPMELVGVGLPGDRESVREMAYTFAEELAARGWSEGRLVTLFRTPFYAGAHQAWRVLGEDEIRRIVGESVAVFGRVRFVERAPRPVADDKRRGEEV